MSSDYHLLCVNHDPAIVIDHEWATPAEAVAAMKGRSQDGPLAGHQTCDLLIGRYSGALVEACCPGGSHAHGRIRMHVSERWAESDWLRLLYHAYASQDPAIAAAVGELGDCWPRERVLRLRDELRVGCG